MSFLERFKNTAAALKNSSEVEFISSYVLYEAIGREIHKLNPYLTLIRSLEANQLPVKTYPDTKISTVPGVRVGFIAEDKVKARATGVIIYSPVNELIETITDSPEYTSLATAISPTFMGSTLVDSTIRERLFWSKWPELTKKRIYALYCQETAKKCTNYALAEKTKITELPIDSPELIEISDYLSSLLKERDRYLSQGKEEQIDHLPPITKQEAIKLINQQVERELSKGFQYHVLKYLDFTS